MQQVRVRVIYGQFLVSIGPGKSYYNMVGYKLHILEDYLYIKTYLVQQYQLFGALISWLKWTARCTCWETTWISRPYLVHQYQHFWSFHKLTQVDCKVHMLIGPHGRCNSILPIFCPAKGPSCICIEEFILHQLGGPITHAGRLLGYQDPI